MPGKASYKIKNTFGVESVGNLTCSGVDKIVTFATLGCPAEVIKLFDSFFDADIFKIEISFCIGFFDLFDNPVCLQITFCKFGIFLDHFHKIFGDCNGNIEICQRKFIDFMDSEAQDVRVSIVQNTHIGTPTDATLTDL